MSNCCGAEIAGRMGPVKAGASRLRARRGCSSTRLLEARFAVRRGEDRQISVSQHLHTQLTEGMKFFEAIGCCNGKASKAS
jgi:hypothetical protein